MNGSWIVELGAGGIFALMLIKAFIELTKALKNGKANGGSDSSASARIEQIVSDTKLISIDTNDKAKQGHTVLARTDADGVPMVYFPRSIVKTQEKTAEILSEVSNTQKQMADTLIDIRNQCVKHTD